MANGYATTPVPSDSVEAWVSYPERKDKAPVVIVIHEIFGLDGLGALGGRPAGRRRLHRGSARISSAARPPDGQGRQRGTSRLGRSAGRRHSKPRSGRDRARRLRTAPP
ncbi:MAG: hypothetical protein MZV70_56800 [Desulfobacterales bacterium]|nr:hypothetical protein [Desulfobacterales bacterium]